MKKKLYLMLVVTLILGFAACQDKPTVDSDALETKQPETTLALEKEQDSTEPAVLPTSTPTVTPEPTMAPQETLTPEPTATPTPTPTNTPTPTPTRAPEPVAKEIDTATVVKVPKNAFQDFASWSSGKAVTKDMEEKERTWQSIEYKVNQDTVELYMEMLRSMPYKVQKY